jgi:hypothetical protein
MRNKPYLFFAILILTAFAIQCGQSSGPTSPGMPATTQAGDAALMGSVTASGANAFDFSQVEIGVKDTNLKTHPDQNGNFRLAGLPTGNVSIEVSVQNTVSDLALDNVQSREEIKAQIEINDNNEAQWCHMERNRKAEADLQLEIRPPKWNIDWVNSPVEETACFRIYGDGFADIDSESVVITCDESGLSIGWPEYEWELGGVYFKVFITQQAAIGLTPDALRGETYHFSVTFNVNGTPIETPLPGSVVIVGQKPENGEIIPFTVKISPKKWNIAWRETSGGQVTLQIRGTGFDLIDPDSVLLSYDGNMIEDFQTSFGGNHFSAKFSKQDAISLVPDAKPGDRVDIAVYADVAGGDPIDTSYPIEIVGKKEKD